MSCTLSIANKLLMLNVVMLGVESKPLMLSVFKLNVIKLSVENKPFMLSVFMLNAIMPRAVMPNVVAPFLLLLGAFLRRISPMQIPLKL